MPFEEQNPLTVREVDDLSWELVTELVYRGNRDEFRVPVGYRTDFASIPVIFRWLLPKHGRYTKAAVVHDYLVEHSRATDFTRCDADGIFRRMMGELGVPILKRWIMWAAVRLGGMWTDRDFCHVVGVFLITLLSIPIVVGGLLTLPFLVLSWMMESVVQLFTKKRSRTRFWWS